MFRLQEIKDLTDEKFEEQFDKASKNVASSYGLYIEFFKMRENEKTNRCMRKWTIAIGIMTAMILVLTIYNVLYTLYS